MDLGGGGRQDGSMGTNLSPIPRSHLKMEEESQCHRMSSGPHKHTAAHLCTHSYMCTMHTDSEMRSENHKGRQPEGRARRCLTRPLGFEGH